MIRALFSLFFLVSASCFGQISQNLLLHYDFDGDTSDSSENDFDGFPNGVVFTEDRLGNSNSAVYFDGIDDYIEFPNEEILKPEFPITFSFWARYDSTNQLKQAVFNNSLEDDVSSGVYFNSTSDGRLAINFGDGSPFYNSSSRRTLVVNNDIEIGEWVQIVAIVESEINMRIYVDCVQQFGPFSGSGGDLAYSDAPGVLGRHDRNLNVPFEYFEGALDDFRYWDRIITEEEIGILCQFLNVEEVGATRMEINLYPNPTSSIVNIEAEAQISEIEIYDLVGRKIKQIPFSSSVDVSFLTDGIYTFRFIGLDSYHTEKLIVHNK